MDAMAHNLPTQWVFHNAETSCGVEWSGVWCPQMGDCLLIMLMALSSLIDGKDLSHRVDNQPPSRAETTLNIIGQQEQPLPLTLFDSSWKLETARSNQSQR